MDLVCCLGWSAVVQSWLTVNSNSWSQAILPPQSPKELGYRYVPTHQLIIFCTDRRLPMLPSLVLNFWHQTISLSLPGIHLSKHGIAKPKQMSCSTTVKIMERLPVSGPACKELKSHHSHSYITRKKLSKLKINNSS